MSDDGFTDFTGWTKEQLHAWNQVFYAWEKQWRLEHPVYEVGAFSKEPMYAARRRRDDARRLINERENAEARAQWLANQERVRATDPRLISLGLLGESISDFKQQLEKIPKDFSDAMLTDAWKAGLKASGVQADNAVGEWVRRGSKAWPKPLEFVLEFSCPDGDRTPDKRRTARVQLIILEDGNFEVDRENSSCQHCTDQSVWRKLLTCPLCAEGRWEDSHMEGHPLRQWRDDGVLCGSRAPFAFVMSQFDLMAAVAQAQWAISHEEEVSQEDLVRARELVGAATVTHGIRSAPKMQWSDESVIAWLDEHGISPDASARGAWLSARSTDGHPPKSRIEAVQPRKSEL